MAGPDGAGGRGRERAEPEAQSTGWLPSNALEMLAAEVFKVRPPQVVRDLLCGRVGDPRSRFINDVTLPDPPETPQVLTVTCRLSRSRPSIWRRLELRGELTLDEVHECLQVAMGWSGEHAHHFELPNVSHRERSRFFLTEADIEDGRRGTPEWEARLDQVLCEHDDEVLYHYDYCEDWAHLLTLEWSREAVADDPPARCLKAVGACPAEGIGGIEDWNRLADALRLHRNPRVLSGSLADLAARLPDGFDPDDVDIDEINARLAQVARSVARPVPGVSGSRRRSPGAG